MEFVNAVHWREFDWLESAKIAVKIRRRPDLEFGVPRLRGSEPPKGGTPSEFRTLPKIRAVCVHLWLSHGRINTPAK